MKARLLQPIPEERLWLVTGEDRHRPAVGDIGDTDQCSTGPDGRQMVDVYFLSADGASEWGAEAYETELEPVHPCSEPEPALPHPVPNHGAAANVGWLERWFRWLRPSRASRRR